MENLQAVLGWSSMLAPELLIAVVLVVNRAFIGKELSNETV